MKLHIGCGNKIIEGMVNIDLYNPNADVIMDARNLTYDENTVEEIYGAHVFEHFSPFESLDILSKWFKILQPGGKLILDMPDILEICKNFESASKSERYDLLNCIYAPCDNPNVPGHFFGWFDEILYEHFDIVGFINITIDSLNDPDHMGYNLRVQGFKPK